MICMKCSVHNTPKKVKEGHGKYASIGRIQVDRMFVDGSKIELFCLNCGKRWFIDRVINTFGTWLTIKELEHKLASQG